MKLDTTKFRKKLEDELALLESELKSVGRVNPDNPKDWEARPQETEVWHSDEEEVAEKLEGYRENTAILNQLEVRYDEVKRALEKIKTGKGYGLCEIDQKPIEIARLEANPAATTCLEHMK